VTGCDNAVKLTSQSKEKSGSVDIHKQRDVDCLASGAQLSSRFDSFDSDICKRRVRELDITASMPAIE
jgi:hypothetical protein